MSFHTFSGRQYAVEFSTNLSTSNWETLPGGVIQGTGADVGFTDSNAVTSATQRFYRVRQ